MAELSTARIDRRLELGIRVVRAGPGLILTLLIIGVSIWSPLFLTSRNLGNVLAQSAVISILALGQLLVILTRGIDLSVGATLALATVVGARTFEGGSGGLLTISVMIAVGLAVGLVNGAVFVVGRVPHPFIVTLASLSLVRGLALWVSDGRPIQGMPSEIQWIGGKSLAVWLPASSLVVAGAVALTWFLTRQLVWGRWIYAVGGNPDAARRAAIPRSRVLISVYALSGLAAGIAAVITAGRTNAGAPTFGDLAELDAIAAVIIGGASFLGGRGGVLNAIVGALMIAIIRNAMNLANLESFFQLIVLGSVILLAVEVDVLRGWLERRLQLRQAAMVND